MLRVLRFRIRNNNFYPVPHIEFNRKLSSESLRHGFKDRAVDPDPDPDPDPGPGPAEPNLKKKIIKSFLKL